MNVCQSSKANCRIVLSCLAWLLLCGVPCPAADQAPPNEWKETCARLRSYTHGQRNETDLLALERCFQIARPDVLVQIEAALVGLLRDPAVSVAAKQFICRQGAFLRSDQALTAFAELQAQPDLSFMACYALERMPNPRVAATLQELLGKRAGPQRADVIGALGALGDRQSVGRLAAELASADRQVAQAAVLALGRLGGEEAQRRLAEFEPLAAAELKAAVAEARLRCAARAPAGQAAPIYRSYLKSSSPALRMAAFAGLVGRQGPQRTPLLLDAIRASDAALKSVALRAGRTGGGAELTAGLAAALEKLSPADQAAVLEVLGDRGDPSALTAVLKQAGSAQPSVRMAALSALGRLGDGRQVDVLVAAAVKEKAELQAAARRALSQLRGQGAHDRLMKLAAAGTADERAESIAALAARGAAGAAPLLLRALDAPEPAIQQAAIAALRSLAGMAEYPELLRRALAAPSDATRGRLQELLIAVHRRSADPQQCVGLLIAALPGASSQAKTALLEILGTAGDPRGLEVLQKALQSSDQELQRTALRALAGWPDAKPVEQLLPLARKGQSPTVSVLAIRAAVAMIGRDRSLPNRQKTKLLAALLEQSPRREEARLIFGVLPRAACADSLQLAVKMSADPELANEAAAAVARIRPAYRQAGISPDQMQAALEKAAGAAKSPAIQQQVRTQLEALRSEVR